MAKDKKHSEFKNVQNKVKKEECNKKEARDIVVNANCKTSGIEKKANLKLKKVKR